MDQRSTYSTTESATIGAEAVHGSFIGQLLDQYEEILQRHRAENPELYRLLELQKSAKESAQSAVFFEGDKVNTKLAAEEPAKPLLGRELRGAPLRALIRTRQQEIRQRILAVDADIIPRTQASNRKSGCQTIAAEREFRADVVGTQIRAWRSMLPVLIRRFARISDYRRAGSIKHKITVLMVFGLFAFIFRLSSRREMNRELTGPIIFKHFKQLFPEIDTIPHADTLARVLEHIDPRKIEAIHIGLIKDLIKKKKFRQLLIQDCLPITIDGSQKLYRQGILQDEIWCERKVGVNKTQQYLYTLEANITLRNGLTIPLMTEYLYRNHNKLRRDSCKQDSEITAFERLLKRLKGYFPRLKILLLSDAMFATQAVMETLDNYHWEYIPITNEFSLLI